MQQTNKTQQQQQKEKSNRTSSKKKERKQLSQKGKGCLKSGNTSSDGHESNNSSRGC